MSKPTQLRLSGGKEPRQYMWEAVRSNRKGFTSRQIAEASGQTNGNVKKYIEALNKAALIELVDGTGEFPEHRWRLIRDEGAEYPRVTLSGTRSKQGLGLEALWRTIRIMGEMTAAQAADLASAGEVKVSQAYASNYFSALVRAGYLLSSEYDFQRAQTYRIAPGLNTGPRHPIIQRDVSIQVFDQNLNKVVYSTMTAEGISDQSAPDNDMQQENIRLRKLLSEFLEAGAIVPSKSLLQRAQLELAL